jgi:hypothetical protein
MSHLPSETASETRSQSSPEPIYDSKSSPQSERAERAGMLDLAERCAADLAAWPSVRAILLTGSLAGGRVDTASDIDLIVYHEALPDPDTQEAMKQAALDSGGGIYGHDPVKGLSLYHFIEGIKVDQGHGLLADTAGLVETLATEPSLDETAQHIVATGIVLGRALHGEAIIAAWKERLDPPPAEFCIELVRNNLRFPPLALLRDMGARRGDLAFTYELILDCLGRLQKVYCGLNRSWPPGKLKGMAGTLAGLERLPSQAAERMDRLWSMEPEAAALALDALIGESLDLVDALLPTVDTAAARARRDLPLRRNGAHRCDAWLPGDCGLRPV